MLLASFTFNSTYASLILTASVVIITDDARVYSLVPWAGTCTLTLNTPLEGSDEL